MLAENFFIQSSEGYFTSLKDFIEVNIVDGSVSHIDIETLVNIIQLKEGETLTFNNGAGGIEYITRIMPAEFSECSETTWQRIGEVEFEAYTNAKTENTDKEAYRISPAYALNLLTSAAYNRKNPTFWLMVNNDTAKITNLKNRYCSGKWVELLVDDLEETTHFDRPLMQLPANFTDIEIWGTKG